MNKSTYEKLKAENKAKPKAKRDIFEFLRLWLKSKPSVLTPEQRAQEKIEKLRRFSGIPLGNKKLFKNEVLRMCRRAILSPRQELTKAQIERYERQAIRAMFTRGQWTQLRVSEARAKNRENGLNRYGSPIRNGFKAENAGLDV